MLSSKVTTSIFSSFSYCEERMVSEYDNSWNSECYITRSAAKMREGAVAVAVAFAVAVAVAVAFRIERKRRTPKNKWIV